MRKALVIPMLLIILAVAPTMGSQAQPFFSPFQSPLPGDLIIGLAAVAPGTVAPSTVAPEAKSGGLPYLFERSISVPTPTATPALWPMRRARPGLRPMWIAAWKLKLLE